MAVVPRPKSPPELYGKRRESAKVAMLQREIAFLQEELKSIENLRPASSCIKEVADYVVTTPEPLITICSRRRSKSCGFWKWLLCGKSCFDISCLCCCGCFNGCSLEIPHCRCCCSLPRGCCSWSIPKCCCTFKPPSCPAPSSCSCSPSCNSSCSRCKFCWPVKCSCSCSCSSSCWPTKCSCWPTKCSCWPTKCSCWPTKCSCWPTKCSCWPTKCSCWPTKCSCWPTKCSCWPTKCSCWPTRCSCPRLPKCSSCSLENNCCYSSYCQCCC